MLRVLLLLTRYCRSYYVYPAAALAPEYPGTVSTMNTLQVPSRLSTLQYREYYEHAAGALAL
jgi:hypothetical protein